MYLPSASACLAIVSTNYRMGRANAYLNAVVVAKLVTDQVKVRFSRPVETVSLIIRLRIDADVGMLPCDLIQRILKADMISRVCRTDS